MVKVISVAADIEVLSRFYRTNSLDLAAMPHMQVAALIEHQVVISGRAAADSLDGNIHLRTQSDQWRGLHYANLSRFLTRNRRNAGDIHINVSMSPPALPACFAAAPAVNGLAPRL